MIRASNLTFEEIQAAEEASDNRRRSRAQGYQKMHERDMGVQLMSNGAYMLWHVPKELNKVEGTYTRDDGTVVDVVTYPEQVPEDSFGLILDGKKYIFNLDEFRRWLRWA